VWFRPAALFNQLSAGVRPQTKDATGQDFGQTLHGYAGQKSNRSLRIVAVGTTMQIAQRILCRCRQALTFSPTDDVRQALHFLVLSKLACQRREQSGRLVELVGADRRADRSHTLREPGDTFSLSPLGSVGLLLGEPASLGNRAIPVVQWVGPQGPAPGQTSNPNSHLVGLRPQASLASANGSSRLSLFRNHRF
jgi:hypothetical protein